MSPLSRAFWPMLLASTASVIAEQVPQFYVNLVPLFNASSLTFLNVTLQIHNPAFGANDTLFNFLERDDFTPLQAYDEGYLTASDEKGPLSLDITTSPDNGRRQWTSSARDPVGTIFVHFLAQPRGKVNSLAGRNDLRFDQGGAFGQGRAFLPLPDDDGKVWNMTVAWDIPDDAPTGTRFASSFSDSGTASVVGIPDLVLSAAHFGVGPLRRWPDWSESARLPGEHEREFAMYWIGDLLWNIDDLGPRTQQTYIGTSKYFGDDTSDFHVFFRRDFAAYGGSGGYHSFILEYHEGSEEENPESAFDDLISHEIIHDFALLYPYTDNDKWYVEGIAEYLCSVAPYTGGTLDRATFIQWLNDKAQGYYTESPLTETWDNIIANVWTRGTPFAKAPYTRGFMYLAYLQGLIASTATNSTYSLDKAILTTYQSYISNEQVNAKDFLDTIAANIGDKDAVQTSFTEFSNGTFLVPHADGFAKNGLKMVRKDLHKFELGFGEGSISRGTVDKVIAGSRAEKAGVRTGDTIVDFWGVWSATDRYENHMQLTVKRDEGDVVISWWPRSNELVEAWEWQDISE